MTPNTTVVTRSSIVPRNGHEAMNAASTSATTIMGMMGVVPGVGITVAAISNTYAVTCASSMLGTLCFQLSWVVSVMSSLSMEMSVILILRRAEGQIRTR